MKKFFIVTGCGRSGTQFLANLLVANGIKCGHESVFCVNRINHNSAEQYSGDSSWFAPIWMRNLSCAKNIPVIHIVRNPDQVAGSFYRLGVFSKSIRRQVFVNKNSILPVVKQLLRTPSFVQRVRYVSDMRKALKGATEIFAMSDEVARCYEYWCEWNLLIERVAMEGGFPYMRVKLEDLLERDILRNLATHLCVSPIDGNFEVEKNLKADYPARKIPNTDIDLLPNAKKIIRLRNRYGYDASCGPG